MPKSPVPDATLVVELELSARPANALRNSGLATVGELRRVGAMELLRIPNLGRISLREIDEVIGGGLIGVRPPRRIKPRYDLSGVPTEELRAELARRG